MTWHKFEGHEKIQVPLTDPQISHHTPPIIPAPPSILITSNPPPSLPITNPFNSFLPLHYALLYDTDSLIHTNQIISLILMIVTSKRKRDSDTSQLLDAICCQSNSVFAVKGPPTRDRPAHSRRALIACVLLNYQLSTISTITISTIHDTAAGPKSPFARYGFDCS